MFKDLLEVAETIYINWARYVPSLYRLVVNLNGNDPTKEIMNIINYHVFLLFKFIMENVLNYNFSNYTMADMTYVFQDKDDDGFDIKTKNSNLTNMYNTQIIQLTQPNNRLYNNSAVTETVNINSLTLLRAPIPPKPEHIFVVDKGSVY